MKHCINKYILGSLLLGTMIGVTSCNLDYNPVDTYSDVTEGVQTNTGEKLEFQTKADVESALTAIYELMKNRMEHWYLDLLLIGDSHSDNAYGGTTDSQAMPFENNSIEGSSPILCRLSSFRSCSSWRRTRCILDYSLPALPARQLLARKSLPDQARQGASLHTF